jgi:hypothetical protein
MSDGIHSEKNPFLGGVMEMDRSAWSNDGQRGEARQCAEHIVWSRNWQLHRSTYTLHLTPSVVARGLNIKG